jgi:hypothetical protein
MGAAWRPRHPPQLGIPAVDIATAREAGRLLSLGVRCLEMHGRSAAISSCRGGEASACWEQGSATRSSSGSVRGVLQSGPYDLVPPTSFDLSYILSDMTLVVNPWYPWPTTSS